MRSAGFAKSELFFRISVARPLNGYLGDAVIKKALSPEDLSKIVACRMPKWMRAALETT